MNYNFVDYVSSLDELVFKGFVPTLIHNYLSYILVVGEQSVIRHCPTATLKCMWCLDVVFKHKNDFAFVLKVWLSYRIWFKKH